MKQHTASTHHLTRMRIAATKQTFHVERKGLVGDSIETIAEDAGVLVVHGKPIDLEG